MNCKLISGRFQCVVVCVLRSGACRLLHITVYVVCLPVHTFTFTFSCVCCILCIPSLVHYHHQFCHCSSLFQYFSFFFSLSLFLFHDIQQPSSAHFVQPQNASNKTSHLVHSNNNFGGLNAHSAAAAAAAAQQQQQHQSQQHHAFNHNPNVTSKKDSRFVRNVSAYLLSLPLFPLNHLSRTIFDSFFLNPPFPLSPVTVIDFCFLPGFFSSFLSCFFP